MQPEPSLPQEPQAQQAPKKFNIMAVFVVILVLALAGVGFWGVQQSSALKATQAELSTLQGNFDSLTAEKNSLSGDLNTATTDLEAAKAELETAKSDLSKSESAVSTAQAKLEKAGKLADILYAISTVKSPTDLMAVDASIKALKDTSLLGEWTKFLSDATPENSANFLLYLISSIQNELK